MPNMPNFGNIGGMADKGHNIFEHRAVRKLAGKIMRKANANAQAKSAAAQQAAATPTQYPKTQSGPATGPLPPNAMASGRARRQARAMGVQTPRSTSQASGKAPSFVNPSVDNAPKGRTRNTSGGMASGKTPFGMNPGNPSFSSGNTQRATGVPNRPAPSTNPFSHGPGSAAPSIHTPAPTAAKAHTPHGTSAIQFSGAQGVSIPHAAVNVGDNSPYPTHVHPAGSSTQIQRSISATESRKGGAPNTFTVGSRNIKGGGIAAMGSQLEAGLNARPLSTPRRNTQPKQFGGSTGEQGTLF